MTDRPFLRTHDLALAGGISVQQVRNYEASGMIPRAQRSSSGYRLYTRQHLAALKTMQSLVRGYGWPRTSAIMQALHREDLPAALAIIDEHHAELARKRLQMEQTLSALRLFAAGAASQPRTSPPQSLRVGEAARQVGVRVSALHFLGTAGLVAAGSRAAQPLPSLRRAPDAPPARRSFAQRSWLSFRRHPLGARRIGGRSA